MRTKKVFVVRLRGSGWMRRAYSKGCAQLVRNQDDNVELVAAPTVATTPTRCGHDEDEMMEVRSREVKLCRVWSPVPEDGPAGARQKWKYRLRLRFVPVPERAE